MFSYYSIFVDQYKVYTIVKIRELTIMKEDELN